jgi:hypothetical protein
MDVVRGDNIIENPKTVSSLCFRQPADPAFFILVKFEKKFFFMAPVGDVPDTVKDIMSVGSGHKDRFLRALFLTPKRPV